MSKEGIHALIRQLSEQAEKKSRIHANSEGYKTGYPSF